MLDTLLEVVEVKVNPLVDQEVQEVVVMDQVAQVAAVVVNLELEVVGVHPVNLVVVLVEAVEF